MRKTCFKKNRTTPPEEMIPTGLFQVLRACSSLPTGTAVNINIPNEYLNVEVRNQRAGIIDMYIYHNGDPIWALEFDFMYQYIEWLTTLTGEKTNA